MEMSKQIEELKIKLQEFQGSDEDSDGGLHYYPDWDDIAKYVLRRELDARLDEHNNTDHPVDRIKELRNKLKELEK